MSQKTIWLRDEIKAHERRTPLIPQDAAVLVRDGYTVVVEKSVERIFSDMEYEAAGCLLVDSGSWVHAPLDAYILGIKELPESDDPLKHKHIYFAHAYKGQEGAGQLLDRFGRGDGLIYDLEFLQDCETRRRVTRFSYWAGVAGCAVTLLLWIQKNTQNSDGYAIPEFYPNEEILINELKQALAVIDKPSSLVVGARGQCARGVIDFLKKINLEATLWDKNDTENATSYPAIFEHNLFFNCIYLSNKITPFVTNNCLSNRGGLSIVADISCDPNGPLNPLPIYSEITTFKDPVITVGKGDQSVDVMAIDHLPSFLPRESSCDFSGQLLPYLRKLLQDGSDSPVWKRAAEFYYNSQS